LFHEGVWRVLDDLIVEFRKRGETVPSEVMEDLRSAKSLIHISQANPSTSRDTTQIEVYLSNVEIYLMPRAQKFGRRFVEQWMKRLEKARAGATEQFTIGSTISKFLPGIPRDTPWVRVRISEDISRDTAEAVARESGLLTDSQEKGYLLVYGQKEKLQLFIRKMTEKLRGTKKP
jgi:hypothetical protein